MFKEEHRDIGAPTFQLALMQAMKTFLMAPFFRTNANYAGTKGLPPSKLF